MPASFQMVLSVYIAKNVAAEISGNLCDSVADKLNGKVIGTFTGERISK